jgi:hypothetical protein
VGSDISVEQGPLSADARREQGNTHVCRRCCRCPGFSTSQCLNVPFVQDAVAAHAEFGSKVVTRVRAHPPASTVPASKPTNA